MLADRYKYHTRTCINIYYQLLITHRRYRSKSYSEYIIWHSWEKLI